MKKRINIEKSYLILVFTFLIVLLYFPIVSAKDNCVIEYDKSPLGRYVCPGDSVTLEDIDSHFDSLSYGCWEKECCECSYNWCTECNGVSCSFSNLINTGIYGSQKNCEGYTCYYDNVYCYGTAPKRGESYNVNIDVTCQLSWNCAGKKDCGNTNYFTESWTVYGCCDPSDCPDKGTVAADSCTNNKCHWPFYTGNINFSGSASDGMNVTAVVSGITGLLENTIIDIKNGTCNDASSTIRCSFDLTPTILSDSCTFVETVHEPGLHTYYACVDFQKNSVYEEEVSFELELRRCAGSIELAFSPFPAGLGETVGANVSGLVCFKPVNVSVTNSTAEVCNLSNWQPLSILEVGTCTFTSPLIAGYYPYTAETDLNDNLDTLDPGESKQKDLAVFVKNIIAMARCQFTPYHMHVTPNNSNIRLLRNLCSRPYINIIRPHFFPCEF